MNTYKTFFFFAVLALVAIPSYAQTGSVARSDHAIGTEVAEHREGASRLDSDEGKNPSQQQAQKVHRVKKHKARALKSDKEES